MDIMLLRGISDNSLDSKDIPFYLQGRAAIIPTFDNWYQSPGQYNKPLFSCLLVQWNKEPKRPEVNLTSS